MAWKWDMVLMDIDYYMCVPEISKLEGDRMVVRITTTPEQGKFVGDFGVDEVGPTFVMTSNDGGFTWEDFEDSLPHHLAIRDQETRMAKMPDGALIGIAQGCERSLDENRAVVTAVGKDPSVVRGDRDFWPIEMKQELEQQGLQVFPSFTGTVMTETALDCVRSFDGGSTFERRRIEGLPPMARRIQPFRKLIRLRDGTLLGAGFGRWLVGESSIDALGVIRFGAGHFAYALRSTDMGETWELIPIGDDTGGNRDFDETDLLELPDGRVMAMLRSYEQPGRVKAYMHTSFSEDGGATWSEPQATPMWGYPPQLLMLQNGAIHCIYAHRRYPFGMRACLSYDMGRTWDIENEIIICDHALTGRTGYPSAVELSDGTIVAVYAIERIPRVPYNEDDQVAELPKGNLLIHGWYREPETLASRGGFHLYAGLSRYTPDYIRPRGQATSKVLYRTVASDPTE